MTPVCALQQDCRQPQFPVQLVAEIYPACRKSLTPCPVSGHFRFESVFPNPSILIEFETNASLILGVFELNLNQVRRAFDSSKPLILLRNFA
jgi:hypothetical protein